MYSFDTIVRAACLVLALLLRGNPLIEVIKMKNTSESDALRYETGAQCRVGGITVVWRDIALCHFRSYIYVSYCEPRHISSLCCGSINNNKYNFFFCGAGSGWCIANHILWHFREKVVFLPPGKLSSRV